ncbi:hypothetical protein Mapa_011603 [Marchantia paleacea]|nr:hypothetical protein Mapa_011603 [Marchantia paleacea]
MTTYRSLMEFPVKLMCFMFLTAICLPSVLGARTILHLPTLPPLPSLRKHLPTLPPLPTLPTHRPTLPPLPPLPANIPTPSPLHSLPPPPAVSKSAVSKSVKP